MRQSNHRLKPVKVDLDDFIIDRIGIRQQFNPLFSPSLAFHKGFCYFITGENAGGTAGFGAHVRNGGAVGNAKGFHTLTAIFQHLSHTALYINSP